MYRVGRGPNPFQPFEADDSPANRFDDPGKLEDPSGRRGIVPPDERFKVLYCATQRACAFGETIARYRQSIDTLARLEAIVDDDPIDPTLLSGSVPTDWRDKRRIGWIELDSSLRFANVDHASTINHLRTSLASLIDALGLEDLDISAVTGPERKLTQEISRYVYEQREASGQPKFAGLRYISRHHDEWECWAIYFDRMVHHTEHIASIFPDDQGLIEAANLFGITPPAAF